MRAQGGQVDGDLPLWREGQLQRPVVPLDGGVEALAVQQPSYLPRHRGESLDRFGELDVMQSFGKRRAPRAQSQHEAVGRHLGKTGGEHGDGGGRTSPDVEDPRANRDPVSACRDLRQ